MNHFYRFTTRKEVEVKIRTEENKNFYFGIFTTIKGRGENRWSSLVKREENQVEIENGNAKAKLLVHAANGLKPVTITLPDHIAKEIETRRSKACMKTDKIIIATATNEDGTVKFEKYGMAIAEPLSKEKVRYRMPSKMEKFIRQYASDEIKCVTDGGKDDPTPCDTLYCTSERETKYQSIYRYDNSRTIFDGEIIEEPWTIHLRVVDLITDN